MDTQSKTPKRYNLLMPVELADAVEKAAKDERTTLVHFLRQCIKIGLIAHEIGKEPDSAILVKRGETVERIRFI